MAGRFVCEPTFSARVFSLAKHAKGSDEKREDSRQRRGKTEQGAQKTASTRSSFTAGDSETDWMSVRS